jgi:hypothetical protein
MRARAGQTSAPSGLPARTARERAHAAADGAPAPIAHDIAVISQSMSGEARGQFAGLMLKAFLLSGAAKCMYQYSH